MRSLAKRWLIGVRGRIFILLFWIRLSKSIDIRVAIWLIIRLIGRIGGRIIIISGIGLNHKHIWINCNSISDKTSRIYGLSLWLFNSIQQSTITFHLINELFESSVIISIITSFPLLLLS